MKETGSANRRIARHMGRSDAAIRRYWQKRVHNSRFQRHDGSGRPRTTVDREARLIVRSAVTIHDSSLQRCLARSGWNYADWEHIEFSDKSHFQLCPDNHRRRVWRRLVQRADPAFSTACPITL
ncbi:HTH_Tnp_Tc3_2 domain-containing protein [Trichonephila clavipes]|nr:HTH_Tnp_Tc3_2 domain-containing protein [Trichonephila clavipes]